MEWLRNRLDRNFPEEGEPTYENYSLSEEEYDPNGLELSETPAEDHQDSVGLDTMGHWFHMLKMNPSYDSVILFSLVESILVMGVYAVVTDEVQFLTAAVLVSSSYIGAHLISRVYAISNKQFNIRGLARWAIPLKMGEVEHVIRHTLVTFILFFMPFIVVYPLSDEALFGAGVMIKTLAFVWGLFSHPFHNHWKIKKRELFDDTLPDVKDASIGELFSALDQEEMSANEREYLRRVISCGPVGSRE